MTLDLTHDERLRLVVAEHEIDAAYAQKRKDVEDFVDDVRSLFAGDEIEKEKVEELLKQAESTRAYDLQLLAYAAAVRHKLNVLRAQTDLDVGGGRATLRNASCSGRLKRCARTFA